MLDLTDCFGTRGRRRPDGAHSGTAFGVLLGVLLGAASSGVGAQTAGLLAGGAEDLEPLTLSAVEPLAKGPYELESGGYYSIDIVGEIGRAHV